MRRPEVLFGPAVGDGHRRVVLLAVHLEVAAAEVLQRDPAGLTARVQGQGEAGGVFGVGLALGHGVSIGVGAGEGARG